MDPNCGPPIGALFGILTGVLGAVHGEQGPIDATFFVEAYKIEEIKREFPVKAGMTLEEVGRVERGIHQRPFDDKGYNLGWGERAVQNGNGWIYFWVNGKHPFHCDLVIEDNKVKSVWVMPGNKEWVAFLHYRISGAGAHVAPGRWNRIRGDRTYQVWRILKAKSIRPEASAKLASATHAKEAIPVLMSLCRSKDPEVSELSIYALAEISSASVAVPVLIRLLDDQAYTVRNAAAEAIAGYGEKGAPAAEKLAKMVFTDDFSLVWWIPLALRDLGPQARPVIPILIEALKHQEERVRDNALRALEPLGPMASESVPWIIEQTRDPSEDIRWLAVRALDDVGDGSAEVVRVFADALKDDGEREVVADTAAHALARMTPAPEQVLPELVHALHTSQNSEVRRWTAKAIGNIGPEARAAIPFLIELLDGESDDVRAFAAEALGKMGVHAKQAVPVLRRTAKSNWTKRFYEQALHRISTALASAKNAP